MSARKLMRNKVPTTRIDRAIDRLYKATANWVKVRGGNVVVIGGIQTQESPGESAGKFTVDVKCLGRKPVLPDLPDSDLKGE